MVTLKQALEDLKKCELVEIDSDGNVVDAEDSHICTEISEVIILLESLQYQLDEANTIIVNDPVRSAMKEFMTPEGYERITSSKEECTKWLERGLRYIRRCDELARELGRYRELKLEKRLHTAAIPEGTKIWVIDEDTLMVRPDKYYYGQTEYLHGQKDVWWFTDAAKACERCEQVMLQNDELEWRN